MPINFQASGCNVNVMLADVFAINIVLASDAISTEIASSFGPRFCEHELDHVLVCFLDTEI